MEGPLRIYWDVHKNISFRKLDDTVTPKQNDDIRKNYCVALSENIENSPHKVTCVRILCTRASLSVDNCVL